MIEVNPQHVYSVTYNTNSQSGVHMQYADVGENRRVYYVSASDEPTTVTINPMASQGSRYLIRTVKDDTGKIYDSAPRRTIAKVADLPKGTLIKVETTEESEILTGKLTINVTGDPKDLIVKCYVGSHYNLIEDGSVFTGNKLVLRYDPATENHWYISDKNNKKLFFARLDGKKVGLSLLAAGGATTATYTFQASLGQEAGEHVMDLTIDRIDIDVPVRFEFENTTGNEKDPARLADMIQSIKVNDQTLTDKSWLQPGFTVPNGATLSLQIKPQVRGLWEFYRWYLNNSAFYSSSTQTSVISDNTEEVQVVKMTGLYNSPWRYTINFTNPDRTKLMVNNAHVSVPEGATTFDGAAGYSSPAIKPMGNNGIYEENPLAVYDVVVNGQTIPLDENGCYYPSEMDEVITVTPREYKREVPLQIYCHKGYYSEYSIILDPKGQAKKIVPLEQGWQTVMVNPKDLPFQTYSEDAAVYVDGVRLTESDGYGIFEGTDNLTSSSKVQIYSSEPRYHNINIDPEMGLTYTLYADGEQVANSTTRFIEGTKLKIVPTLKTGLVLENIIYGTIKTPESDGSFLIDVNTTEYYKLHKANSKVTLMCPSEMNIHLENPSKREIVKLKGGVNEVYTFPYESGVTSYTLKFYDPEGNYRVSNINATPSAGFLFDPATGTATGIQDGMTLQLEISEYVKPYSYDIWIDPEWGSEGGETGLSVVYWENGVQHLDPLLTGENKKELAAENFPVWIGAYKETHEMGYNEEGPYPIIKIEVDEDYMESHNGTLNGEEIDFRYNDKSIIIEDPTEIFGKIYNGQTIEGGIYMSQPNFEVTYSINGGQICEIYNYESGYGMTNPSITVPPYATLRLHIGEEKPHLYIATLTNRLTGESNEYQFDANGVAEIVFPKSEMEGFNTSIYKNQAYGLSISKDEYGLLFFENATAPGDIWDAMRFSITVKGESVGPYDLMDYTFYFEPSDEFICESLLYEGREIKGFTDLATGESLDFDPETGRVSGLSKYVNENRHMDIGVTTEEFVEPYSMTIYTDNTNYNSAKRATLATGTLYERDYTVTNGMKVDFRREDMPLVLRLVGWSGSVKTGFTHTFPNIYLNGELYAAKQSVTTSSATANSEIKSISLPYNVADGSIVRAMMTASTGAVSYVIEDGLNVDIHHDVQKVADPQLPFTLCTGTVIKITPREGEEDVPYVVYRNGAAMTKEAAATGFAVANATEEIRIEKPRNEITISSADMDKLFVYDSEGTTYDVTADNLLRLSQTIESLTIVSNDEEYYVSGVNTGASEMQYDEATGVLSNLGSGTVTVTVKKIEREQEVSIYVDGGEVAGGSLTLGNGKQLETNQELGEGNQTIQFSEEDLPIIFRLPDSYFGEDGSAPSDPSKLPTVIVNGETLTYSPEHKGYVFPVEAFSDPQNPPVIKIYPAAPVPTEVSYLVEPGVTFSAVPDGDAEKTVAEAGTVEYLPGTIVKLTATATKSNEEIFIEVGGEVVAEGSDIEYTFQVGADPQMIQIKRKKVAVTISNDDFWRHVRVNGGGFTYPLYDATSELEFPVGTNELTFRTTSDTERVVRVINAKTGNDLTFNPETGVLTGIADGMKLSLEVGDMIRNRELTIYLEESEQSPAASLIIAEGKAVEKETHLQSGYQKMMFASEDLPMGIRSEQPLKVYLDNVLLGYDETTGYEFPAEMAENPVVKVYGSEQPTIKVNYNIEGVAFDVEVRHDHAGVIDTDAEHHVLPGTEITFTVDPKTIEERRAAARKAGDLSQINGGTEVTVNGEAIEPDEDGIYSYKANAGHAAEGLSFVVKRPNYTDPETGYVYSGDGKTLISVPKDVTKVVVPNTVTTIAEGAFDGCDKLETVVLGSSVESVPENAFKDCEKLGKSIYPETLEKNPFPESVPVVTYEKDTTPVVDENGFVYEETEEGKKLIFVPDSVEGTVTVPEDVTEIGKDAFTDCKDIENIVLGKNVTTVDPEAFTGVDNLEAVLYPATLKEEMENKVPETIVEVPYTASTIEVDETGVITGKNENGEGKVLVYVPKDEVDENGTYTIPEDITEIGGSAFTGCDNLTNITIPENVEKIGEGAFSGCDNLTEVELTDGLKEIGGDAFKGTGISELTIPETVTTIGDGAFSECENLTELEIPDTVEELGEGVMSGCENLTKVHIPEGVEEIGAEEFKGCTSLKEVTIPETVTSIGEGAFEGCSNLENVTIPETVTTIGENAFKGCESLTKVEVPEGVDEIGAGAFEGCTNLENVNIPENVTSIGANAFNGCKNLENVTIPDNVTEIGEGAFKGCESLTTMVIPPTVDTIGEGAFEGCSNLDKCVYPDKFNQPFGEGVGVSYPADEATVTEEGVILTVNTIYYVPSDVTEVEIPETVTDIKEKAFKDCKELVEVTLPAGLEELGKEAFAGCTSLTEIEIPNQVKTIEEGAFKGCTSLSEVNVGNAVTEIGAEAFAGCEALHSIDIHSNVHSIGASAFQGAGLTEVHIGAGMTSIAANAFAGCHLSEIAITAQTPPTLGENALGDNAGAELYVQGAAMVEAYHAAAGWNVYAPKEMVEATRIDSFDATRHPYAPGETLQLTATVYPSDAKLGAIFWESSNPQIATVDRNGLVKMNEGGIATFSDDTETETGQGAVITVRTMYANGPERNFVIGDIATGLIEIEGEGSGWIYDLIGKAEIYSLSGVVITSETRKLEPGVYVVKYEGKTYKVKVD